MSASNSTTPTHNTVPPQEQRSDASEYSVCVLTAGGWVYVAEFQTYQEAIGLAEAAVNRSGLRACIKSYGTIVADYVPEQVAV